MLCYVLPTQRAETFTASYGVRCGAITASYGSSGNQLKRSSPAHVVCSLIVNLFPSRVIPFFMTSHLTSLTWLPDAIA